ncbi:MAG TPA: hemerythrin domain-containing protein [Planctomycetota bacterium]
MHRLTDNLRADHAVTSIGLAALNAVGEHVRRGGAFPAQDCALLLRFVREFVLAVHMRKETELVCPAVAMRGDHRAAATVGRLLRLHAEVTELSHSLVLFWEPVGELSPAERLGFADTAAGLASRILLMQSIEERELFPACDASVPADDQLEWAATIQQQEAARGSCGSWARRITTLARKWVG